jgi:membrane protease YdiL (CAAX protease family)
MLTRLFPTLQNWIRRHSLVSFFILAYAINFIMGWIYLGIGGIPYYPVIWLLQSFSPTISAVLVAGLLGGLPEIKDLLSGFTRWRTGLRWYLAALGFLLGPLAVAVIYFALGNPPAGLAPGVTASILGISFFRTLISGPLGEETGWRGFALPRLQEKFSAFTASVLLGLIWAFWHVPFYLDPVQRAKHIPFLIFIVIDVALALLFTWIYNNTGGSLVATVLAHFSFNLAGTFVAGHLGLLPAMLLYMAGGVLIGLWAVLVIVFAGPRNLSRKPVEQLPFRRPNPADTPRGGTSAIPS